MATKDILRPRERQVLELIAQGYTSCQIGLHLNLSERTVEAYRNGMLRKTDSMNTVILLRNFFDFVPKVKR